jgi:hypothetical protein
LWLLQTQTTFTISLKRSALVFAAGRPSRPNIPSDSKDNYRASRLIAI